MNTYGKLNRSYSESELHRKDLENVFSQDSAHPCTQFQGDSLLKRTVLFVEDVCRKSPLVLKSGYSIPNELHIYSSTVILKHRVGKSKLDIGLNQQLQPNCLDVTLLSNASDGIDPMDVDFICDNSKAEETPCVVEKMDVDMDYYNYKLERLSSLDKMLKNRKFNRESLILSEKSSLKDDSQINHIRCDKNHTQWTPFVLVLILVTIITLLYFWVFQSNVIFVNSDIQLQNVKKDLLDNVYDQKGPISIIVRSLEHRSHWKDKIKILVFVGPSGVGKTFVANILKKHFHHDLVHELYGIQLNFKRQWEKILNRLKMCCLNLIIIDDLNKKDTIDLFELVHLLPKNTFILIISIFNIQFTDDKLDYIINYDDINAIRSEFDNSDLFYELAIFNQFNIDQVKDWLEKNLKVRNVKYNDNLLNDMLSNHNASIEGFKGLQSKMSLKMDNV